ncbi:MAG: type II secretion system protein N [Gammaproteobacteria bacterium]|nr:type II secretion system protein N [Gammaproteobacteria bacterium]
MKTKHYLLIGFLALFFFLIVNIPAAPVYEAVKAKIPQLQIQNIEGSIWNGSAQQITVQSRHVLKNVNWSVCLAHILIAEACVDFDVSYSNNPLSGQISVNISNNIQAKNIETSMTAKSLSQIFPLPLGEIAGNIDINIESLNWTPGSVPAIQGEIQWHDASITIAQTAKLGNVTITLNEPVDNPVNAEITNKDGDLAINGRLSLGENTDYKVDLTLTPRNKQNQNIKNSLSLFAKSGPDGSYTVKNNGNLKQLGLM